MTRQNQLKRDDFKEQLQSYLDNEVEQERGEGGQRYDPDNHDECERHSRCDAVLAAADDASVAVYADQSQRPDRHKTAHKTETEIGERQQ